MKTFSFAAVALLAATPAFAAPGPVRTVATDDRTISYTVDRRDDGSMVLASAPREPSNFRLRVKNGWVSGNVGGFPVAFRAPQPRPVRGIAD